MPPYRLKRVMISGDRRHSHSSTRKDVLICENGHFIIIYSLRWRENNGPVLPWHTQSLEKFLRHVLQLFRRGRERRHLRAIRCLIVGLPPSSPCSPFLSTCLQEGLPPFQYHLESITSIFFQVEGFTGQWP